MGTKQRRSREKAARRETILEAARGVFAERGILATTIDEIAERAEVAKGTIYLYFKSKEEMLSALLDEGMALVRQRFGEAIDLSLPADENLRRLCDAYCRLYREEPQYFKLLFFLAHADVRAKICSDPTQCQGPLSWLIQKGIDEGVFSPKVDPSKAAAIAWASSNGIILLFEQDPQQVRRFHVPIDELLRLNMEVFIRGLKAEGAA